MPLRVLLFAVPEKDEEAVAALLAEAGPWAAWRSREGARSSTTSSWRRARWSP